MEVDLTKVKHGIPSTYNNYGCRCEECRKAWAKYMKPRMRKYRAKKKKELKLKKRMERLGLNNAVENLETSEFVSDS